MILTRLWPISLYNEIWNYHVTGHVTLQECRRLLEEVNTRIQRWGFGNETTVLIPVITAVSCEHEADWRRTVEKLAESIVRFLVRTANILTFMMRRQHKIVYLEFVYLKKVV